MNDIRNLILDTIFNQCVKLLAPHSHAYKRHSPELDGIEISMLSQLPPVLEYLQMGGIELSETTGVTLTPALYIANATESLEIPQGSGLANFLGIETPFVGESYPVVLAAGCRISRANRLMRKATLSLLPESESNSTSFSMAHTFGD